MSVFANVNGEIKELYRIFFNDDGVIREVESLHAQNDNNEIKELFARSPYIPKTISWVTYGDESTLNYLRDGGGYSFNGRFTSKKRSVATYHKIYLPAGTQIRVELSNIIYETSVRLWSRVNIYLFDSESTSDDVQAEERVGTSTTMTVRTAGYYYITFAIFARDGDTNIHYFTSDLNITIYPPKN